MLPGIGTALLRSLVQSSRQGASGSMWAVVVLGLLSAVFAWVWFGGRGDKKDSETRESEVSTEAVQDTGLQCEAGSEDNANRGVQPEERREVAAQKDGGEHKCASRDRPEAAGYVTSQRLDMSGHLAPGEQHVQTGREEVGHASAPQPASEELSHASAPQPASEELSHASAPQPASEELSHASAPQPASEELSHASAPQPASEELSHASAPQPASEELSHASAPQPASEELSHASAPQPASEELSHASAPQPASEELSHASAPQLASEELTQGSAPLLASEELTQGSAPQPASEEFTQGSAPQLSSEELTQGSAPQLSSEELTQGSAPQLSSEELTQGSAPQLSSEELTQGSAPQLSSEELTQGSAPQLSSEELTQGSAPQLSSEELTQGSAPQLSSEELTQGSAPQLSSEELTQGSAPQLSSEELTQGSAPQLSSEELTQGSAPQLASAEVSHASAAQPASEITQGSAPQLASVEVSHAPQPVETSYGSAPQPASENAPLSHAHTEPLVNCCLASKDDMPQVTSDVDTLSETVCQVVNQNSVQERVCLPDLAADPVPPSQKNETCLGNGSPQEKRATVCLEEHLPEASSWNVTEEAEAGKLREVSKSIFSGDTHSFIKNDRSSERNSEQHGYTKYDSSEQSKIVNGLSANQESAAGSQDNVGYGCLAAADVLSQTGHDELSGAWKLEDAVQGSQTIAHEGASQSVSNLTEDNPDVKGESRFAGQPEARLQDVDPQRTKRVAAVQPMQQNVSLDFKVHYVTHSDSQIIAVTGDHDKLGKWEVYIPLSPEKDGVWSHSITLPGDTNIEWKFVMVENGNIKRWEECSNRCLKTAHDNVAPQQWWGYP